MNSREILLCPVARSPLRISAGQIRAVPTLIVSFLPQNIIRFRVKDRYVYHFKTKVKTYLFKVNLGLTTGPAKIVQCVFVTRGTEVKK